MVLLWVKLFDHYCPCDDTIHHFYHYRRHPIVEMRTNLNYLADDCDEMTDG